MSQRPRLPGQTTTGISTTLRGSSDLVVVTERPAVGDLTVMDAAVVGNADGRPRPEPAGCWGTRVRKEGGIPYGQVCIEVCRGVLSQPDVDQPRFEESVVATVLAQEHEQVIHGAGWDGSGAVGTKPRGFQPHIGHTQPDNTTAT